MLPSKASSQLDFSEIAEPPDEDSIGAVNSKMPPAVPTTGQPPAVFNPYDAAQRAARDAAAVADSKGARTPVAVDLPSVGAKDWTDVSSDALMRAAYMKGAASRGVPDSFASEWLKSHPDALRLANFQTGEEKSPADLIGPEAYDPNIATRPLQAASTVVAGEQRAAGAMLAAPFSKSARDVLASGIYDPKTQLAAAITKLRTGVTPEGYEQPVAE